MDKQTIIRYLNDELSDREKEILFTWIESSSGRRYYFIIIKNLWTICNLNRPTNVKSNFVDLKYKIELLAKQRSLIRRMGRYAVHVAAVMAVPLAIGLSWVLVDTNRTKAPLVYVDIPMVHLYSPVCTRSELTLPDGTHVWLNSGSKLSYPRMFEGEIREVILDGEGYFDVVHNSDYPFVIQTPHNVEIRVKGTSFNLSAYADDDAAEIALVEGVVDILRKDTREKVTVKPRESVRAGKGEVSFEVKKGINTSMYTAWLLGTLTFDDTPMCEMTRRLERWYGVTIIVEDKSLLDFKYTGSLVEERIGQVLELIKQTSSIDYRIEEKNVYLSRKRSGSQSF